MALKKLPTEAQWFPYPDDPDVRVSIYHQKNPAFQDKQRRDTQKRARANMGRFSFMSAEEIQDQITEDDVQAMRTDEACNLVADWSGVEIETDEGIVAVPYCDRRDVLGDPAYADFRDWIVETSHNMSAHKEAQRKAILGNSNGASGGSTAGALTQR